uniref:Sorting nexin-29 n=2 Tax=Culex pipiens TaxID=7175 RepID=A0A8D8C8W0_CULPI
MVGMSNFFLDPPLLGGISAADAKRHEIERKTLSDELLAVVKECQKKYGSKTELATENDSRIVLLCDTWERVLTHGLKSNSSVLKNVTDLMAGGSQEVPVFWDFAYKHLTNHEKERFSTLRHVWTNGGKGKSLLRAVLNERALERYMLMWLGDEKILEESYESWALIRDGEFAGLLPNMAAGLRTILFAISIDAPELNAPTKVRPIKVEPIIAAPPPAPPARKINAVPREILDEPSQPVLNLSSSPTISSSTPRRPPATSSIDIIREYTHVEREQAAYSVEDALNSLSIGRQRSRESTGPPTGQTARSPDNALEASEDSIMSLDVSNVTTSTLNTSSTSCSESSATQDIGEEHDAERCTALVDRLKRKLTDSEERCQMLEARVAELSLENHRLRMLTRPNRLSMMHFQIVIPKAILRTPVSGRRRAHYCYEIRIAPASATGPDTETCWSVFRRYSEFLRLHKRLQKEHPTVKTLDFPPKKKIGNMNPQFVEQRRQRLQVYLNSLFITVLPEVSACNTRSQLEAAFPFLSDARL